MIRYCRYGEALVRNLNIYSIGRAAWEACSAEGVAKWPSLKYFSKLEIFQHGPRRKHR
jgi:hypothetical protein